MHMLSKKDLSSEELETLRRSRIPTVVVTANGEVQTNEEAQENVHDLDLFVTVQFVEDTSCCFWIVVKLWYQFVFYIATAGLIKYIFKSSNRAK